MKIKRLFFEFFKLNFQFNSSTQNSLNSKSIEQFFFPQMAGKVIWNCRLMLKKRIPTLNTNIFQSIWSNFIKILPHDHWQVKYKIVWLYSKKRIFVFLFLDECNKNDSFKWILKKNGLGLVGVNKGLFKSWNWAQNLDMK